MGRKLANIVLGTLLTLLAACATVYLCRDPLATELTAWLLDRQRGVSCTHPEVEIDASLQRVSVAPFQCWMPEGPISAFSTLSNLEIQLDGVRATRVRVARAIVDRRERDVSETMSSTLSELAGVADFRDQLIKSMLDASETFQRSGPVMTCRALTMKRAGRIEGVLYGFERSYEQGWERTRARRVESGPDFAELRDLDMRVTPKRGELSLEVFLDRVGLDESPDLRLTLVGQRLNERDPHFRMQM